MRHLLGVSVAWVALSLVLDGLTVLLLPFRLANEVDGGQLASAVGIVSLVGLGLATATQPLAGLASDRLAGRVDRRAALAFSGAVTAAGLALFGLAEGGLAVLGAYVAVQVAAGVMQAVQQTFIPDRIPSERRGRASGLKGAFDVGGAFLAFIVLAPLLEARSPGLAVAVLGAILIAATMATLVLLPRRVVAPPSRTPLDRASRRAFAALIASRFLFLLGIFAVGRFLLLLVADRLALDPRDVAGETAVLFAALALVTAVSAAVAGHAADRVGRRGIMTAGALVATVGIVGLTTASVMPSFLVFGVLMAIGSGSFGAANWAMTSDLVAGHETGRLMGIANFGTGAAAAIAGGFGLVIDSGNALGTGAGYGLLLGLAAVSTLSAVLPLRRLPPSAPAGLPAVSPMDQGATR